MSLCLDFRINYFSGPFASVHIESVLFSVYNISVQGGGGAVAAVAEAESTPNRSNTMTTGEEEEGVSGSTTIAAKRGSCQDRVLDGDRGQTRELSSPRA